ncbi:type VII secretion-associated serine protease mycosin [Winogradskya consettensis]|uniref:Type VII secretion-associated serine protease n=1 Tax=Winogradskya consettensis TaxID=113560 RepID=A0A919SW32_9ACTN|nr:S8 family serine peptidase [Actinoplanes consettensis]GIM78546.1 type VII secretion-associated serine protease [Actinoplanes consettensis]
MIRRLSAALAVALAFAGAAVFGSPAYAGGIRDEQWHLTYLKIAEAQRISSGKGVVVAVIDTGVNDHPDLAGSLLNGADFVVRGGSGQNDPEGHGTAVAGLIAAHGKGGNGALGIAPDAEILPVRVMRKGLDYIDIGSGVDYAISHGAKVINISLAVNGVDPKALAAVAKAAKADVVIIAGVGNRPEATSVMAPAKLPGVVGVGATDKSGELAKVSVTGSGVDIAAPGVDIASISNDGIYIDNADGTSYSSAIVSGAAALLRSKYPEMSAKEVVERLESTAVDKGAPGVDDKYGHGVLDIVAALEAGGPGGSAPSASATTSASDPSAGASGSAALPEAENSSGSGSGLLIGGVVLVILLGAGALFFVLRARSRSTS